MITPETATMLGALRRIAANNSEPLTRYDAVWVIRHLKEIARFALRVPIKQAEEEPVTDHIPLTEARAGDIVHLKPMIVDAVSPSGFVSVGPNRFPPSVIDHIDHIERAPRVLKVGDRVRLKGSELAVGVVLCIHGSDAWVGWPAFLTNLEPVE